MLLSVPLRDLSLSPGFDRTACITKCLCNNITTTLTKHRKQDAAVAARTEGLVLTASASCKVRRYNLGNNLEC